MRENIRRRHRNVGELRYTCHVARKAVGRLNRKAGTAAGLQRRKSELDMNKGFLAIAQDILNAFWQLIRGGPAQPAPPPKVKLDGRRGYGDGEIPPHERNSDEK